MTDEELDALQDELTEARADNERLQVETADAEARIRDLTETLSSVREELAQAREDAAALRARHEQAVVEFRRAALAAEPDLPPDLVSGVTVEEVLGSLAAARTTVEQVRERLAQEAPEAPRVPAGSPARRTQDLGGLSARDNKEVGNGIDPGGGGEALQRCAAGRRDRDGDRGEPGARLAAVCRDRRQ